MATLTPASGVPLFVVTVPVMRPPELRPKLICGVVLPRVTVMGVPLLAGQG
jgi:hypothetical protein